MSSSQLSPLSLLLEARAIFEAASLIPAFPLLKNAPSGRGQPILTLPGFMADDSATFVMRSYLKHIGYKPYAWKQGRNPGLRDKIYHDLEKKITRIFHRTGQKVNLIGWSLGGVYARTLAHRIPKYIHQVITLGSPFSLNKDMQVSEVDVSSSIIKLYELLNPDHLSNEIFGGDAIWREAPPVPSSSIYTKQDGVTSWKYCIDAEDELTENIKVIGSHCGLTHNPMVLWTIADRLAQHEGQWKPFSGDSKMTSFA